MNNKIIRKTKTKNQKTPRTTGVGEDVGKKEPSYTVGGKAS
jgi:hypothetical protein